MRHWQSWQQCVIATMTEKTGSSLLRTKTASSEQKILHHRLMLPTLFLPICQKLNDFRDTYVGGVSYVGGDIRLVRWSPSLLIVWVGITQQRVSGPPSFHGWLRRDGWYTEMYSKRAHKYTYDLMPPLQPVWMATRRTFPIHCKIVEFSPESVCDHCTLPSEPKNIPTTDL